MGDALLEIEDLAKSYKGHVALDGVSLSVREGEICGLLGPNGAGKTSLVSIIAGLRDADRGSVRLDGIDVAAGGRATRSLVGLAAQETAVYPTVTVRNNLVLFADLAGLRGADRDRRIEEVAGSLDLDGFMDRLARNLSGGEKRRLHAAMALVHRPRIVLLDEPTTGVDVTTRTRLLDAVGRLAADEGSAVLYSTHYLPEIEQLRASVVVLDHGRVLARGSLDDMVQAHGGGAVEITLVGPPPQIDGAQSEVWEGGSRLRIPTERPGSLLAEIMVRLGPHAEHVVSVEVLRPNLESVFLELTGRRYGSTASDGGLHDPSEVSDAR